MEPDELYTLRQEQTLKLKVGSNGRMYWQQETDPSSQPEQQGVHRLTAEERLRLSHMLTPDESVQLSIEAVLQKFGFTIIWNINQKRWICVHPKLEPVAFGSNIEAYEIAIRHACDKAWDRYHQNVQD